MKMGNVPFSPYFKKKEGLSPFWKNEKGVGIFTE